MVTEACFDFLIELTMGDDETSVCSRVSSYSDGKRLAEGVSQLGDAGTFRAIQTKLRNHLAEPMLPGTLEETGRAIGSILFPPPCHDAIFGRLLRHCRPSQKSLARVRFLLRSRTRELSEFPWEYAYLESAPPLMEKPGFLSLHPGFHIIRESFGLVHAVTDSLPNLRVLVAWADPASGAYAPLSGARAECRSVISQIEDSPDCRRIIVHELEAASEQSLRHAVEQLQPNILHFIGHAEASESGAALVLHGESVGHRCLPGEVLRRMLRYPAFRLLTISACDSTHIAEVCAQDSPLASISIQMPWRDSVGAVFSRTLYSALTAGTGLEDAVAVGRGAIRGFGPDWGSPVLTMQPNMSELVTLKRKTQVVLLPHAPNPDFTGRDKTILEIASLLNGEAPKPVALCGIGGSGKSQVALEYAHRAADEYPAGVYWINAANEDQIRSSFDGMAPHFNLPESIENRPRRVLEKIQQGHTYSLMIFDNITSETDLSWLPSSEYCSVLATSRAASLLEPRFNTIDLSSLDQEAAISLLQRRRQARGLQEAQAAAEIARLTGYLPLAVSLAEHHAHRLGLAWSDYLDLLSAEPIATLTRARTRFNNATGHDGSLFDGIRLAISSLCPASRRLIQSAACFAESSISSSMLARAASISNPVNFLEHLAELKGEGLLRVEAENRYSMHELVRMYVRESVSKAVRRRTLTRVAQTLVSAFTEANRCADWKRVMPELTHAAEVARLCETENLSTESIDLLYETGYCRLEMGQYNAAANDLEAAVRLLRETGQDETLRGARAYVRLGIILRELKDRLDDANRWVKLGFDTASRLMTDESGELAEFYNARGIIFRELEHFEEAIEQYHKGMTHCEDNTSAVYSSLLNNCGAAYEELHEHRKAIEAFNASIALDTALYGDASGLIAIRLNNRGRNECALGEYVKAWNSHNEALRINVAVYGETHPTVAASRYYLGRAEEGIGKISSALSNYLKSYDIYMRYLDADHFRPTTVRECIERVTSMRLGEQAS